MYIDIYNLKVIIWKFILAVLEFDAWWSIGGCDENLKAF